MRTTYSWVWFEPALSYACANGTEQTLRLWLSSAQAPEVFGSIVEFSTVPSPHATDTLSVSFSKSYICAVTTTVSWIPKVLFPAEVPLARLTCRPRRTGGKFSDSTNTCFVSVTVALPSDTYRVKLNGKLNGPGVAYVWFWYSEKICGVPRGDVPVTFMALAVPSPKTHVTVMLSPS